MLIPITASPYYRNVETEKIPADNTFIMRNGEATTFEKLAGKVTRDKIITGINSVKESAVLIRNVGFYKGQPVNVKVSVEMMQPNGADLQLFRSEFLRLKIWPEGISKITYEFLDKELQPFTIKTTFNEMGLNKWKDLSIANASTTVENLFARPDSTISYTQNNDVLNLKGKGLGDEWADDTCKVAITTKPISKVQFIIKNNDSRSAPTGISELKYLSQFFPNIEFPYAYPQQLNRQKIVNNEVISSFQQTIPYIEPDHYLDALSYKAVIADQNQFQIKGITVKDFYGNDRTNWFDQQIDPEGNLLINAKTDILKNKDFYDNSYQFNVHYLFIGGKENPVDTANIENDCFHLKAQLYENIGEGESLVGELESNIDYMGEITIQYVDEENTLLLESGTINQLITKNVDLTEFYPAIEGYYPIREPEEKDQIIVTPESQIITHHYKKGAPLLFTLKNTEDSIVIPRFSRIKKLSFRFSHDIHQSVQLIAQCGEHQQVLKKYNKGTAQAEDTIDFQVPEDWLNKKVAFFIQNEEGQCSTKEARIFIPEAGPRLYLPEQLEFGTKEIPASDQLVAAENEQAVRVEDDSKLERSHWTIKIRLAQPLENENQDQLKDALIFSSSENDTVVSSEDQAIWSGSGPSALGKENKLRLFLHPTDRLGNYSSSLIWTFEDAPD